MDFGKDTPAWARKKEWATNEVINYVNEGKITFYEVSVTNFFGINILTFMFVPVESNDIDKLIDWM